MSRLPRSIGLASSLSLCLAGLASAQGTTVRASVGTGGVEANGGSSLSHLSADGRIVVFDSIAHNLGGSDTQGSWDVFARDLSTGVTEKISYGTVLVQQPSARSPSVSWDGRYVAYDSANYDIVPNDNNLLGDDVFVFDRLTGTTVLASTDSNGMQAPTNHDAAVIGISGNGRYVSFTSYLPGKGGWRKDLVTNETIPAVADMNGQSIHGYAVLSSDGRFAAFHHNVNTVVPGDLNGKYDVFVRDLDLGLNVLVSVSTSGIQGDQHSYVGFGRDAFSADARYLVFVSDATNLVAGDLNGRSDVFVRDLVAGKTERVSLGAGGEEAQGDSYAASMSADARFVVFVSYAPNLVPGDSNVASDVFVRDRLLGTTIRASVSSAGAQGDLHSGWPAISADASRVSFTSFSGNLVDGDTNGAVDIFVHERAPEPTLAAYCLGDGSNPSVLACPCANTGASGAGCANSVGSSGLLTASGTTQPDTLVLASSGMLPSVVHLYLQATGFNSPGTPFGDGVHCLAGGILRLEVESAIAGASQFPGAGDPSISARSAALGDSIAPGSFRHYQTWYRDPDASFCPPPQGREWNVTNGVRVLW